MKILGCMFAAVTAFAAKPVQVVELKSSQLEVLFDPLKGLPAEYRLNSNKATIRGAMGDEVGVTIYGAKSRAYTSFAVRPEVIRSNKTRADFQFTVREKGVPMASFLLRYELIGAEVLVSLEAALEEQGFELIDVALPDLASVREEDGGAWLAHGDGGGSVAMLSRAKPGHLTPNPLWGGVATTLPVAMVGTNRMLCVEEVLSPLDTTELAVENHRALLGTVKTWRVNGVAGNSSTPNLMVGGRPLSRLDFLGDFDHNGVVDWLDGAKLMRERMTPIPTHFYDDKLMYTILCDEATLDKPSATFADAETVINRVSMLTGGAPQVVYLQGWQYRGKGSGFPAVAEVDARLGGFEGFVKLRQDAAAMNATISLADDYDNAYQNSPAWDSNMIARRPDGELWEARKAYVIGLAKYMDGPGPERIRYTADRYRIRDTHFIDNLAYFAIRNDWDRERPASGAKNLVDGRYKVIEDFKAHGLDVVSDELRYALLGKISVSDHGPSGEESPFGGETIPLAAAIYRKSAIWGMRGDAWKKQPELKSLFYNGHRFPVLPHEDWEREFTNFYYGELVPWYQVHYRNIESFLRDGDRTVIGLEGNSKIDLDWSRDEYSVAVNGAEVARDGDTFCPIGKDRVAFYSRTTKELSAPLPEGWDPGALVARSMFGDKTETAVVTVRDGKIAVRVQPEKPVVVYRDAGVK